MNTIDNSSPETFVLTAHVTRTPSDIKRAALPSSLGTKYMLALAGVLLTQFVVMELTHAGMHLILAYGCAAPVVFGSMWYTRYHIMPHIAVERTFVWEMDLTLTPHEVFVVWRDGSHRMPWHDVSQFRETEDDIHFVSESEQIPFAFPKRTLPIEVLREFQQRALPKQQLEHIERRRKLAGGLLLVIVSMIAYYLTRA